MAAPTSVRAEATSIATTTVRWAYAGSNTVALYRSTDGIDYSLIATVEAATLEYADTGLATITKYWYKLTDDVEATFSDVVTVYTHACPSSDPHIDSSSLPQFLGDDQVNAERLNELVRRVEEGLNGAKIAPDNCVTCPTDGAVAVDCRNGCNNWTVILDQDVNSVSINWCEQFPGSIAFVVPPGETWGVCGFPAGFGFTGDECSEAPIAGGAAGNTATAGWNGTGNSGMGSGSNTMTGGPKADANKTGDQTGVGSGGGSGPAGGGGCACIPGSKGQLAIKSCTPLNSIGCASAKSLKLIACGGRGPYTWSNTGSLTLSATTGNTTTVTPPANAGSAVAGNAYSLYGKYPTGSAGACATAFKKQAFTCADVASGAAVHDTCGAGTTLPHTCTSGSDITTCNQMTCVSCTYEAAITCGGASVCPSPCASPITDCKICTSASVATGKLVCDTRTAGMVTDGCAPCAIATNGATVTVTDATGVAVTVIIVA